LVVWSVFGVTEEGGRKTKKAAGIFPTASGASILFPCQGVDRSFGRRVVRKPFPCIRTRMAWVAFTVGTAAHGSQDGAPDVAERASRAAAALLTWYA
jgi:hypothetical protein